MPSDKIFRPADYVKISIFAGALSILWPSLHSLIIPLRILDFIPEAQKNTYLGLLTFAGSLIALFVQPLAGAVSDRFGSRWGRRRPFIFAGTILALLILPSIGLASSFVFLLVGYCLLQIASNIAQGPFQAFIPDLVPHGHRGVASSAKSLAEILGAVVFLRLVAYFMDNFTNSGNSAWLWGALSFPGTMLLVAMIVTMVTVKESPSTSSELSPLKTIAWAFRIDTKANRGFIWYLVSRLLVLMGGVILQTFALYYISDVLHQSNPAGVAANLLITVGVFLVASVYPAGQLSDRFGRKPVIYFSGFVGVAGILVLLFTKSYTGILVCGALMGLSTGAFLSTNWALATDLVPTGEEARYLGLTNIATAGAGALARLMGPVIDFFNGRQANLGYSIMLVVCIVCFIFGTAAIIPIKAEVK